MALLHAFFSNLPQEWLEGAHLIIKHLRPVTSVAVLRIAFRIMGPVLPRLANAHNLFNKVMEILSSCRHLKEICNPGTPFLVLFIGFLHHFCLRVI